MARIKITIDTAAYTSTWGHAPRTQRQEKSMWAFQIDTDENVAITYGTYAEALAWAKAQARVSVEVLP